MPYKRAPIAEAVLDLHVNYRVKPSYRDVEAFCAGLVKQFPHQQRVNALQLAFQAKAAQELGAEPELSSNSSATAVGVRAQNAQNDRVLVVRMNGFSYSHLAPYTEWSVFKEEAQGLWDQFIAAFGPIEVTRSAVRYVNRIMLPNGCELEDYLNLSPRLLKGVPRDIEGYFMQLVMPQPDIDPRCSAVLNTGLEDAASTVESLSVLLDIDIFIEHEKPVTLDHGWQSLDKLRGRKNQIFEAAITDKVRRMIE